MKCYRVGITITIWLSMAGVSQLPVYKEKIGHENLKPFEGRVLTVRTLQNFQTQQDLPHVCGSRYGVWS